ncbi:uncharacterized protein AMSG_11721 [Thecamonas trahens ATCC 50062]|uniref:GMP phosphodiesterase delta subunit domain-containing protein n=1 Tax=Thecamonas trahens ATCC 50062 TaxID=461836 RepID=A0A0L0D5F9_THETB|nr:hypothetical protein AMSG_11721 [Thecamonas trahens ATCC 50062]KNC47597.1 hypothetical protein AMSG_11721 [Thecamonas trahens ATCC 50062]|eukprot:XP_013759565.1 hypothetical protein AMSG_11721 [Thecamonas trahens ATCC 50062]
MGEKAEALRRGFSLGSLELKDAESGEVYWQSQWDVDRVFDEEQVARVPARLLAAKAVSREIVFSSVEMMQAFRVEQEVSLHGSIIEEFHFEFGFVIPNSTNTWSTTLVAADAADMLPADVLSGNVVIETRFYDAELLIATSLVRVFYDAD